MTRSLEDKRTEVAALCRRHRVSRLAVFGSASGTGFRPGSSDVDLVVEFEPMPAAERAKNYFELLLALENLLAAPVDLAEAGAIANPYVQREILATQQVLYGA